MRNRGILLNKFEMGRKDLLLILNYLLVFV